MHGTALSAPDAEWVQRKSGVKIIHISYCDVYHLFIALDSRSRRPYSCAILKCSTVCVCCVRAVILIDQNNCAIFRHLFGSNQLNHRIVVIVNTIRLDGWVLRACLQYIAHHRRLYIAEGHARIVFMFVCFCCRDPRLFSTFIFVSFFTCRREIDIRWFQWKKLN